MVETAAHLVDHVLPPLPVRQWVLSVPKRLRPFLHHNPRVAGAVLRIFLRAIRTTLRDASPGAGPDAQIGAISFLHRFGSSLNADALPGSGRRVTSNWSVVSMGARTPERGDTGDKKKPTTDTRVTRYLSIGRSICLVAVVRGCDGHDPRHGFVWGLETRRKRKPWGSANTCCSGW